MPTPLKFIFFPLSYLLAHVGRLTLIAEELRARGHEVTFAGVDPDRDTRSKLGFARKAGFRLVEAPEPDYRYAWNRFEKYGWVVTAWDLARHQQWAPLDTILDGQVRVMDRERPNMVVGDGTISVSTAAHIVGIPAAGVMNSYNHRYLSPTSVFMPMIRLWDALHLSRVRGRIYRKYGVARENALGLLRTIPMLSPDLPGLFPEPEGWPNWHTVGPILSEPPVSLPSWYGELDDGTPNVYVTMGSTGFLEGFLQRTYGALSEAPFRFLLTTGGQVSERVIQEAPPNFRIADYAPGSKLVEKSCALIFHGGNGTMYQGLAAGVPMVALPSHLEQAHSFRAALTNGLGLQLSSRRVRGDRLVRALTRVLEEPSYRAASASFSEAVRRANGPAAAADLLERHARAGVPVGG